MKSGLRPIELLVGGVLGLTVIVIAVAFFLKAPPPEPPPVHGVIPEFSLTNQFGKVVSNADLAGKVTLANIIFSRCAGPCPELCRLMEQLDSRLKDVDGLQLLSLTADPDFDTPEVLGKYGKKFQAREGRWHFLTGSKLELYQLAMDGLKLSVQEKEPATRENINDLFIHSMVVTVVDGEGQLRGFYQGLDDGQEDQIVDVVRTLVKESR